MDEPNYFDRIRIKRTVAQVVELMQRVDKERIATKRILGFEITLWRRGLEISRPRILQEYTVYLIGWWPPLFKTRTDGIMTHT